MQTGRVERCLKAQVDYIEKVVLPSEYTESESVLTVKDKPKVETEKYQKGFAIKRRGIVDLISVSTKR
ncbi:hypothetical protein GWI33_017895 [Rhynchophorus ferrugineus]|uniref:Uncharacterized protein n=1 Tax=Rhynchophorus ferrugineus TaxID=354439 RepID=A0A834HXF0_RHYFE|nr:hypothetical protein GWI33_017895 [Rhynchophorus ferrugineus]